MFGEQSAESIGTSLERGFGEDVQHADSDKRQRVLCPEGHVIHVLLPTELDYESEGDPRSVIFDQQLGRFTCPSCDRNYAMEQAMTYVDHARGQCIRVQRYSDIKAWSSWEQVSPSIFEEVRTEASARSLPPPALYRLVFGFAQLREKLLLWEAGLDDRLVELAKLDALSLVGIDPSNSHVPNVVLEHVDIDGWQLVFSMRAASATLPKTVPLGREGPLTIDLEQYESLKRQASQCRARYPELFQAPFVSALRFFLKRS